jgi:hypothetical protein
VYGGNVKQYRWNCLKLLINFMFYACESFPQWKGGKLNWPAAACSASQFFQQFGGQFYRLIRHRRRRLLFMDGKRHCIVVATTAGRRSAGEALATASYPQASRGLGRMLWPLHCSWHWPWPRHWRRSREAERAEGQRQRELLKHTASYSWR